MKRIYLSAAALLMLAVMFFTPTAHGQMQTLVHGGVRHGGYGGPIVTMTWLDGEPGIMVGGGGAWIVNGTFAVGGQGIGLATMHSVDGYETRHTLEGGYGGLTLEYFHRNRNLAHASIGTLIGAGGMAVVEGSRLDPNRLSEDDTAFFVARPYGSVSLNITHFFQVYATGAYRFVVGSDLDGFDDRALSGAELGIGLRFGSF